jgi:diguanylate cyclase (GGDEF)-like protein/PAS domain S-box-containing protein
MRLFSYAVPSPRALRRYVRTLLIANLVVLVLLGAVVYLALHASHQSYGKQTQTATENLSSTLGAAIAGELKLVDNALLSVRLKLGLDGGLQWLGRAEVNRLLEAQHALVPWALAMRIADADGVVRFGPGLNPASPINVADRSYFMQARQQHGDLVVLSEPLQSRIDGRWGIAVARALTDSEGRFAGIVYATLPVAHFEKLLGSVELGDNGAATLRTASLALLARVAGGQPASNASVGSKNVSPQFEQAIQQAPQAGFFVSRTPLDGVERSNAYQRIEPYPLLILTGLSTAEFYVHWRRHAIQLVSLAAFIMVVLAGFSVLLARSRRANLDALARVAELAREQSAMLDNELIGIVKARDRTTLWMNKAMERIFGYRDDELLGQSSRLLHADDASHAALASAYASMAAEGHYRTQLQMRRKDGELIWIDLSGTLLSATDTLWLMADITPLKQSEDQIRHAALHDALTGLPNRMLLAQRIDSSLRAAAEQGKIVAVAMIDLDGFKAINDRHGHAAGDTLLVELAHRLKLGVRGHDTVARWGGDEFIVVLTGLDSCEHSRPTLQRLLVDLQRPVNIGASENAVVGASIGVAFFPADGTTNAQLISVADQRMFTAKRGGRRRIVESESRERVATAAAADSRAAASVSALGARTDL